ncbi:hypothetical protein R3I94_011588 [Phoxinus phoxinus]
MKNILPSFSVTFMWLTASTLGNTVHQTPTESIQGPDESAVFICTHNIPSYYQIMWYKQIQGTTGLKLMGYLNGETENKEAEFTDKIILKGNGRRNGTLTVEKLTLNDSAVYFCAAYDTLI